MESSKNPGTQGIRLLQQLLLHGKYIFSISDAIESAKLQKIPLNQVNKILSNLSRQGRIHRLRRGLYLYVGLLPGEITVHPFAIAAHLVQPSVISHWSALNYHGLTEQIPHIVSSSTSTQVITPSMREAKSNQRKIKHMWEIDGVQYEYIHIQAKHLFGIEKLWIDENFQISITDKERTLLELFIHPNMFGGIGEALGVLEESLAEIDIKKLIDYAIRYNKKSLAKRLGWALEYFGISREMLEPLLRVPIHHYCRLDAAGPAKGPCDKSWMIQNNLIKENKK